MLSLIFFEALTLLAALTATLLLVALALLAAE